MTKEEAIRQIENRWSIMDYGESEALGEALDMAIESLSADRVEVVRCKDCEHADFDSPYPVCNLLEVNINEDCYCSWAKMKGGDE